jgi:ABC-type sugar transport system substrate-binding protein
MYRKSALLLTTVLAALLVATGSMADTASGSKRIEVYSLSMNYWDTKYGESLSGIVQQLLPNNPSKQQALAQDIIQLNPNAFINGDADRMLANHRLKLPGYMTEPDSKVDPKAYTVETFSWGNIKRPK